MTTPAMQRLGLTRALEDYNEDLVQMAEETLSKKVMTELLKTKQFMSQLNNLSNVAREATGPATVTNWVRYQMGRQETWRASGFGDNVLANLKTIREMVGRLGLEARGQERHAEMVMIRRYTGYLPRWFVAKGGRG